MSDGDQTGRLGSLLNPLTLPRQALNDLEALAEAARSLPGFERELLELMQSVSSEVHGMRTEMDSSIRGLHDDVQGLDGKLSTLQEAVRGVARDLDATKSLVAGIREDLGGIADALPDPNERGPLERAKDALTGNDPDEET